MTEIRTYDSPADVAHAAAENAVEILSRAIDEYGAAVWVVAGGTSPKRAYEVIAKQFAESLDWSMVTVIMGDERAVSFDSPDSNWGTIMRIFESNALMRQVKRIEPVQFATLAETARQYDQVVRTASTRRWDLVWLGVGEDGHTLSLFPNNSGFTDPQNDWVIPVTDAPKPPADRLSFSLTALEHVDELVIFATGAKKKAVLREARLHGKLPIAVAAEVAEMNGAEVRWLYDDAAWGEK